MNFGTLNPLLLTNGEKYQINWTLEGSHYIDINIGSIAPQKISAIFRDTDGTLYNQSDTTVKQWNRPETEVDEKVLVNYLPEEMRVILKFNP